MTQTDTPIAEMAELPRTMPGHWDTPEGREMALRFVGMARAELPHGDMSDLALGNRMFMAGRNDLDLLSWQQAAKDRIRWLSTQLALRSHLMGGSDRGK